MLCTNSTTGRCLVINNVPSSLSFLLLITQSRVNVLWDKKQQQPQQEGSLDLFSVSLRDPALLLRALFPLSSFNLFIFRFCVKKNKKERKVKLYFDCVFLIAGCVNSRIFIEDTFTEYWHLFPFTLCFLFFFF